MSRLLLAAFLVAACSPGHDPGSTVDASESDASVGDADPGSSIDAPVDAPAPPPIAVLRGVDRANGFNATEAQSLKTNHGVKWTGVYIGGPCDGGSGWNKAQVTSLFTAAAWKFMPIYVGQQSPAICGRANLTAAQGTTDAAGTVSLMHSFGWEPHRMIPVVLDLEAGAYTYSPSGATAYTRAWRDAVRAAGYLAYVYSNPTALNGLYNAGVTLDGAWAASWFYSTFANVQPSDLTQLGTHYTQQNRAWQYAGEFPVTGAGTGLDGNTSDLILAPEPGGTNL